MARLAPFEPAPLIAVAVSGGADSLCLAILARDWALAQGGRLIAVTVDHRLRPESAAEAARVAAWMAELGIAHHILTWDGLKPESGLQAAARAARYDLLERFCAGIGCLHLLLGHHQDDQAETLLLRLARGSGVDGLAAMAPVRPARSVRLLRPLLDVPGGRLAATLRHRGQDWITDPSNANEAFARVRMRRHLADGEWNARRLAGAASHLARARAALEQGAADLSLTSLRPHPAGFVRLDVGALLDAPEEVSLRLLSGVLRAVGGGTLPPRLDRLERCRDDLAQGRDRTFSGCHLVFERPGHVVIGREIARAAPPVAVPPGRTIEWDNRIRITVSKDAPPGLMLGPLGAAGWRILAKAGVLGIPASVRAGLPALFDAQGVCSVPQVGYNYPPWLHWMVPVSPVTITAVVLRTLGTGPIC